MVERIPIQVVNDSLVTRVKTSVQTLSTSTDAEKQLVFELNDTKGPIPLAYDIIKAVHSSAVDLVTESSGNLSAAGTLLAASGKPSLRKAELSTTFALNDKDSTPGKMRKVDNPDEGLMKFLLGSFSKKKRAISDAISTHNVISSVDAYSAKIIDDVGGFKNKYEEPKTTRGTKKAETA